MPRTPPTPTICPYCGKSIPSGSIKVSVSVPLHLWQRAHEMTGLNQSDLVQFALRHLVEGTIQVIEELETYPEE